MAVFLGVLTVLWGFAALVIGLYLVFTDIVSGSIWFLISTVSFCSVLIIETIEANGRKH